MSKYADVEGFKKKDPFKKEFIQLHHKIQSLQSQNSYRILPESLSEPAALIDFGAYDFYLAFKTDGVGTKSLIADQMASDIRKGKGKIKKNIASLYQNLGVDLIASNINDLICLGATPISLSDEIAAGNYHRFIDPDFIKGFFAGLKKGCIEANISIPCGESPTLTDIVSPQTVSITGSAIGIVKPKEKAVLGKRLKAGDAIFAFVADSIHTNGLTHARTIASKLSERYFTPFGTHTLGEELLKPTKIYSRPILEMLEKNVDIHYMSNISGSAFRKVMRAKKSFTYIITKLPRKPKVLAYLQKIGNMSESEAYETWNMGLGFVILAPYSEEKKMQKICKKHKVKMLNIGYVTKGEKQVIIKPLNVTYKSEN